MAQKLYNDTAVQDIADAIREKNGEPATTKYKIAEMGDAIRAIPGGGGEILDASYLLMSSKNNIDREANIELISKNNKSLNSTFYNSTITIEGLRKIEALDTSNVTNFTSCFYNTDVALNSNFDWLSTENGTLFTNMFRSTTYSYTIDCSFINTKKGTSMLYMFDCSNTNRNRLTNTSNLDLTNATNTSYMFRNAIFSDNAFKPKGDMSKVTDMSYMFSGIMKQDSSTELTIDLSDCNLSNVTSMKCTFGNGNRLGDATIKLGNAATTWKAPDTTSLFSKFFSNVPGYKQCVVINGTNVLNLTNSDALSNATNVKFYVPDALVNSYKTATNWSARAAYIFPLSEYVEP